MSETFTKKQKSRERQDRQREKAARRAQKRQDDAARPSPLAGDDPDIAWIVPGPQPLPDE